MIYIACGGLLLVIGFLWLILPAKKPNRLYGYLSYLAQTNDASFRFAQKRASYYFMFFGGLQLALGYLIHFLHGDRYFLAWLLTFYLFIIFPVMATEKSLKQFLVARGELPHDYVDPDKVKHEKSKGFKDR